MTAFVFAYGLSAVILSVTSDFFGPRRTLSAIALILAVVMRSWQCRFLCRHVHWSHPPRRNGRTAVRTANIAVKQWFRPGERGFASALWSVVAPLGSMIGFSLVIALVAAYGWRSSFYLLAGLNGLVALPVIWFLLRDRADVAPPKEAAKAAGTAVASLLGNVSFWLLAVYDCGAMIYVWGFNSWLPAYLQEARHFDVKHSGMFSSLSC